MNPGTFDTEQRMREDVFSKIAPIPLIGLRSEATARQAATERELFLAGQFASGRFRGSMRESFGEFSPRSGGEREPSRPGQISGCSLCRQHFELRLAGAFDIKTDAKCWGFPGKITLSNQPARRLQTGASCREALGETVNYRV